MNKLFSLSIILFILNILPIEAQIYTQQDSLIFEEYVSEFRTKKELPIGTIMAETAKYFLGKPYVASTLDNLEEEELVVNLREFDCIIFVEICTNLSQMIKGGEDLSFTAYCNMLRKSRYRGGVIDGYTSRLHYTTEWIIENKNRLFDDITLEIGGGNVTKVLNFMSTNKHLYKQLKNSIKITNIEKNIAGYNAYNILPLDKLAQTENKIESGDIIVFGTRTKGLDFSHVGIAYWENGKLGFIHASSAQKQIVIDKRTLLDYCKNSKTCSGLAILRLAVYN